MTLYRYDKGQPWKFTDGVEFTFLDDPPITIPAGGYILLVKKPAAFSWRYPTVPVEKIPGPYDGKLNNADERLEIGMPGDVDNYGERYYIRVGRVNYSDGSHPENCSAQLTSGSSKLTMVANLSHARPSPTTATTPTIGSQSIRPQVNKS